MDLVRRLPLWEVADLRAPDGVGDKRILRHLARHLLGLSPAAAALPKVRKTPSWPRGWANFCRL